MTDRQSTDINMSSAPYEDDFDATDEYLDAEQEERDKEDPRVLIPFKGIRSAKMSKDPEAAKWDKSTPYCRKGDILWWLCVQSATHPEKSRPPNQEDLHRVAEDFKDKGEYFHPRLCVLQAAVV